MTHHLKITDAVWSLATFSVNADTPMGVEGEPGYVRVRLGNAWSTLTLSLREDAAERLLKGLQDALNTSTKQEAA